MENTKKRIAAINERGIKMDRKPISKKLRIDDNLKTKDQFEHLINSFKSIYTWGDLREEIESVKSW